MTQRGNSDHNDESMVWMFCMYVCTHVCLWYPVIMYRQRIIVGLQLHVSLGERCVLIHYGSRDS